MGSGSVRLAQITGPAKDNGNRQGREPRHPKSLQGQRSVSRSLSSGSQDPARPTGRPCSCTEQPRELNVPAGHEANFTHVQRTGIMRAIKPIERLVPVSSTRHRAYTSGLSTWSSSTALIGSTRFEVGFPLRCLQRLSRPYIAMLHCGWRHNSSTRGTSIPVLSY